MIELTGFESKKEGFRRHSCTKIWDL